MSNGLIALLLALGAGTWIYSKLMRSTGGLTKQAVVASVIAGGLIFMFVLFALSFISD